MFAWRSKIVALAGAGGLAALASAASAAPVQVIVTVENLAPENGTFLTPVWVAIHDGNFDIYDRDVSADPFPGLEPLAEDGNTGPISDRFDAEGVGVQATLPGATGPVAPGETVTQTLTIDDSNPSQFFSYASMILPSNDAFIANGNPQAHPLFDAGSFVGTEFIVTGAQVLDAGTEVNDEIPENTAFFGQTVANTGVDENGVVVLHEGFLPAGSGGILDAEMFANADFTQEGYEVARFSVQVVPLPPAVALFGTALAGLAVAGWRKRRNNMA